MSPIPSYPPSPQLAGSFTAASLYCKRSSRRAPSSGSKLRRYMRHFLLTIPTRADQEGGIWGQPLSRIARSLIFPVCICTWSKLSALLLCKAKGPLSLGYLMACQRDADPRLPPPIPWLLCPGSALAGPLSAIALPILSHCRNTTPHGGITRALPDFSLKYYYQMY
jgi:hypothetical protein